MLVALATHILDVDKKLELMLTRRAKAYSSSYSQTVSLSPAILSRLLRGYRSLMLSCASFLEPRKSRLRPSKFTFNAKNFVYSLSMSVSIGQRRNLLLKCVSQPEIAKKIHKTYFSVQGHPRSLNSVAIEASVRLPISD